MKKNVMVVLGVSVLALTACSSDDATKIGSRDDIIIKNRGDVPSAMTQQAAPMVGEMVAAPAPDVEMETMAVEEEAMNVMDADVVVQDVVQPEVQEVQQVQEVEKTINGSIEKIEEVVMEEMPSTQIPTTPEMVEPMIEAASEEVIMPVATPSVEAPAVAVETSEPVQQIVEQAPARVSPYVPTY